MNNWIYVCEKNEIDFDNKILEKIKREEKNKMIKKEYFENKHIEYTEINSNEGSILTKIVCLIYFLDYSSIYHAILSSTDPSPVSAIDFVKKKL